MLLSAEPEAALGNMADTYRRAAMALADMQRHRVCPTPQAYELWLAYQAEGNAALTRRVAELLGRGDAMTAAVIQGLRAEFEIGGATGDDLPAENHLEVSDELQDAAASLVQDVTTGRLAISDYGQALAQGVARLGEKPSGEEGMRVVAMLASETLKMAEHNRNLRERLASTSAKVERLRRMLASEKQAASTDQLTGLANRRAFDARVKRGLGRNVEGGGPSASLLLLDIDHFKRFNDTYGHSTGDLVLRLVGRLLLESIKGRDIAARYGGEEFAILLMGADLNAAATVARQICTTLAEKRFKLTNASEQGQGRVTISIGVAELRATDTLGSAMDRADVALYEAKRAGRNRVTTEKERLPD